MTDTMYKRRDVDIAINYRLNDYLKLFAGAKQMAYKAGFSGEVKTGNSGIITLDSIYTGYKKPNAYGPGLGLNCTLPVIENLFILGTLSGFYLWGKEKDSLEIFGGYKSGNNFSDEFSYKEYGINSNLSIAYYITSISTVISLGGRMQYFKTDCGNIKDLYIFAYNSGSPAPGDGIYNGNKIQKIYGITLTATYSFSL